MNFWTKRVIVFPDLSSVENEECSTKPGTVLQRDISAFAMQFEAKANARDKTGTYTQSYLNELVVRYGELDVPLLVAAEEIERT